MIKSPVLLAVVLPLATLAAVGYQAFQLNKVRLREVNVANEQVDISAEKSLANNRAPGLAQLAMENLMGNPQKPVERAPVENAISIASLRLTLIGTITKVISSESSAIIQRSNRETKRYFIGDIIESGVSLTAVSVDSVVLTGQGQSEMLRYPQSTSMGAVSTPVASAPVAPIYIPPPVESPSAPTPDEPSVVAAEPPPLPENPRMASLRDRFKRAQIKRDSQQNPAQQQGAE